MKRITNTQYIKKGMLTNVGTVAAILDNKWFDTTDGFSHNLDVEEVVRVSERRVA